jgi:hypothetical protein
VAAQFGVSAEADQSTVTVGAGGAVVSLLAVIVMSSASE